MFQVPEEATLARSCEPALVCLGVATLICHHLAIEACNIQSWHAGLV